MLPLILDQVSFAVNGRTLIDRVSMEIAEGPRTIILGPNGAGKSVLMRLCHGLLMPTAGTVEWRGARGECQRANPHPDRSKREGFAPSCITPA